MKSLINWSTSSEEEVQRRGFEQKIINRLLSYLDLAELKNLSSTNKAWRNQTKLPLLILFVLQRENLNTRNIPRIQYAVLQTLEYAKDSELSVIPIKSGFSPHACNFKIEYGDNAYVLRLLDLELPFKSRQQQTSLYEQLSDQGVSPNVVFKSGYDGIVVTKFIESIPKWHAHLRENALANLASKLRKFHSNKIDVECSATILTCGLPKLRMMRAKELVEKTSRLNFFKTVIEQFELFQEHIKNETFAHNDLNPNNILYDGANFWIIDLESAGYGSKYFDIAMIVAAARFSTDNEKLFLQQYFGRDLTIYENSQIRVMKAMARLRLSISFLANNTDEKDVLSVNILEIPCFSDYSPKVDGEINMGTSQGNIYISVMLAKEAFRYISSQAYLDDISVVDQHTESNTKEPDLLGGVPSRTDLIPDTIMMRILSHVDENHLQNAKRVNRRWNTIVNGVRDTKINKCEYFYNLTSSLPDRRRMELTNLLARHFTVDVNHPAKLENLNGGLSPWVDTFLLELNRQKYVIRVLDRTTHSKTKQMEFSAMKLFSHLGASPVVECVDMECGIIVMRYINSDLKWMRNFNNSRQLGLIRLLHCIHDTNTKLSKQDIAVGNKFTQLHQRTETLIARHLGVSLLKDLLSKHDELNALLSKFSDGTVYHYDLNLSNILNVGDRFWAIDWEFAQTGNRFFDLATVNNFLRLSPTDEALSLVIYIGGRVKKEEKAQYDVAKQLCYLRYAICSLGLIDRLDIEIGNDLVESLPPFTCFKPNVNPNFPIDKNTDNGKVIIAIMLIKQAYINMESDNFKRAVEIVNEVKCIAPEEKHPETDIKFTS